jgi:hypothetical protein
MISSCYSGYGSESISRVDYAVDILLPTFAPVADRFVVTSHTGVMTMLDTDTTRIGSRSQRVTFVTIGSMPRRQVIVYDKRDEVIAKHKVHWWEIWNAGRRARGCQSSTAPIPSNHEYGGSSCGLGKIA